MRPNTHKKKDNRPTFVSNTQGLDYELLDCGNQRKLERFGTIVLNRPEVEAKWSPKLSKERWKTADWYFFEEKGKKGEWKANGNPAKLWYVNYQLPHAKLKFKLELTNFKHIGLFPEQAENWRFIQAKLSKIRGKKKVLNLFAYTGAASIVSAACGAEVTNVDSVKQVLNWARENAQLNQEEKIRWILEDARKYVDKAIRRGENYDGIILDPPAFGYGSKKEVWKLERDLQPLLSKVSQLLKSKSSFLILNTYSPKLKVEDLKEIVSQVKAFPNHYSLNELGLTTSHKQSLTVGQLVRF
tara:strand:- start:978 stop:1874 length:897 start_codon:yes stop_codon:yes gene_type:complete